MDTAVSTSTPSSAPATQPTSGSSQPSSLSQPGKESSALNGHATSVNSGSSPSQPELFEVKVNGRTQKLTKDELIAHAQMSHAAQARFEEAAQIKKQVERIISTLRTNPLEALSDPVLGLTKDQIRDAMEKWYTREFIDPETLTPEQLQWRRDKEELERLRQERQEREFQAQQAEHDQLTTHHRDYYSQQIIECLEKSNLPKSKFLAGRMAFYMLQNQRNGWDAPQEFVIRQVKEEMNSLLSGFTESASAEQLIEMLGEGVITKIRQHDLKQLRARRQIQTQEIGQDSPSSSEKVYSSDVNKRLREMRTRGW